MAIPITLSSSPIGPIPVAAPVARSTEYSIVPLTTFVSGGGGVNTASMRWMVALAVAMSAQITRACRPLMTRPPRASRKLSGRPSIVVTSRAAARSAALIRSATAW